MSTPFNAFKATSCDYFGLSQSDFSTVTPNLISPHTVTLPKSVLTQAQNIVSDLYKLTRTNAYQDRVAQDLEGEDVARTDLFPLLCSLDVHVLENGDLKIIEVNTNASGYLINALNYRSRGIETFPDALTDLEHGFRATIAKNGSSSLAIIDDRPPQQKLYVEFLMYEKFFENTLNCSCEILDPSDIKEEHDGSLSGKNGKISGIYNRHTDFYLKNLPHIRRAHNSGRVLLSPNPWGYALLADKKRMIDMQNPSWAPEISLNGYPHLEKALLKTKTFAEFSSVDELWNQRARFFFKPSDSFGSKSVYSGKSISRKKFDEIYSPKMLAQELAPAPLVHFETPSGAKESFKYDLRFLFFEGKVQLGFARLYNGQLTNLQSTNGGHAPLVFG